MATFDSTKTALSKLLEQIIEGKIQLPDFQRGWVWDDSHIRSLLVSIARSFPIGSIMLLETGGTARFQIRPVEGVELTSGANVPAENLILDGQQRLTSLTQAQRGRRQNRQVRFPVASARAEIVDCFFENRAACLTGVRLHLTIFGSDQDIPS